nr:MAG TPA: Fz domain [Crassvirales sp.]
MNRCIRNLSRFTIIINKTIHPCREYCEISTNSNVFIFSF